MTKAVDVGDKGAADSSAELVVGRGLYGSLQNV